MHIPDGMLETRTWATAAVGSAGFVAYAVREVRARLSEGRLVLMAVLTALIFALQMLNFPVAGGTSGHFGGGAAAAILLGPWPAVVILTTVLVVQAFIFGDGGIAALGANVLNIAIIAPFAGWFVYAALTRLAGGKRMRLAASFAAGWTAVVVSAVAVALELVASNRGPLPLLLGSMTFWHALIGVGEGIITAGLVGYVLSVRPDLLHERASGESRRGVAALALLAAAAAALSFLASRLPDGLEYVSSRTGVPLGRAAGGALPDYMVPGVANASLATALAGLIGALLAGAALFAGGRALVRSRQKAHAHAEEALGIHRHAHRHDEDAADHAHPHHHVTEGGPAHEHTHGYFFERYTWLQSPVHALDPRAKIAAALALVLTVVLLPPMPAPWLAAVVVLLLGTAALARLPLGHVLARSAMVLPFAGTIALLAPLAATGGSISWAGVSGAYAGGGWIAAYAVLSKAWLSTLTIVVLSATTPVPLLFKGLERLRVPDVVLMMLSFTYRYVDAMHAQLASLRRALDSRGASVTGFARIRLYGHLAGNLFLRSYERGERVYAAMRSRGYEGTMPSAEELVLRPADGLLLLVTALAIAALVLGGTA